jgi:hypothetical protein
MRKRKSPSQSESPKRKAAASASTSCFKTHQDKVKYLTDNIGFQPDLADLAARGNAADELFQLARKNFKISEGDPLIVLIIDPNDPASAAFANCGNYGLPAGAGGVLAWPGGVAPVPGAGPVGGVWPPQNALGNMIRAQPGINDVSTGGIVFYARDLTALEGLNRALTGYAQFRRLGVAGAALAVGGAVEPPLVRFVLLDKMTGPPHPWNLHVV